LNNIIFSVDKGQANFDINNFPVRFLVPHFKVRRSLLEGFLKRLLKLRKVLRRNYSMHMNTLFVIKKKPDQQVNRIAFLKKRNDVSQKTGEYPKNNWRITGE